MLHEPEDFFAQKRAFNGVAPQTDQLEDLEGGQILGTTDFLNDGGSHIIDVLTSSQRGVPS